MFVPVVPDWSTPPRETYEFLTPVFQSDRGREWRAAARTTPRRTFEFAARPEEHRRVRDLIMRKVTAEPYRIADFTAEQTLLLSAVHPGEMVIEVTGVPGWMKPGARIALAYRRHAAEVVVTSVLNASPNGGFPYTLPMDFESHVSASGFPYSLPFDFGETVAVERRFVTISYPVGQTWPMGTQVFPVVEGFFDRFTLNPLTAGVVPTSVVFSVLPTSEPLDEGLPVAGLNGREALVTKPDWTTQPTIDYPDPRDFVDFERGRISVFADIDFLPRASTATYRMHETETRQLIAFFKRMKGRRGEFYRPSWMNDMVPAATVPPGGTTLRIAGNEYALQYGDLKTYPAIAIHWIDGRVQLAYLKGMTPNASETWLTVDGTAFPDGMTPAQVSHISWVSLARFASDEMSVTWTTRDLAEVTFTCIELPEIEADAGQGLLDNGALWLLGLYGEDFVVNVLCDPLDRIVNVEYPAAIAGL